MQAFLSAKFTLVIAVPLLVMIARMRTHPVMIASCHPAIHQIGGFGCRYRQSGQENRASSAERRTGCGHNETQLQDFRTLPYSEKSLCLAGQTTLLSIVMRCQPEDLSLSKAVIGRLFSLSRKSGRVYFSIVNIGNWLFLGTLPVTLEFLVNSKASGIGLAVYFSNWTVAAFFAVLSPFAVAQRCRDIGWSGWIFLLSFVPVVNFVLGLVLMVLPGRHGEPEICRWPEGAPP